MTIRFIVHSIAKRADAIALVDSGATENFMNLTYAKWLRLPIKKMAQPRKLFNIDGTENKAGELQFYTDLQSLKKLSQCWAAFQRLMQHKSKKLHNNVKIIYVIL